MRSDSQQLQAYHALIELICKLPAFATACMIEFHFTKAVLTCDRLSDHVSRLGADLRELCQLAAFRRPWLQQTQDCRVCFLGCNAGQIGIPGVITAP